MRTHRVEFLGSFPEAVPDFQLPEVAFIGRSNVGKSSVLNALVGVHKAARTSRTPGRTQLLNAFRVDDVALFVDLPGYGFAKVPQTVSAHWESVVGRYLADGPRVRGVVLLVDGMLPAQKRDLDAVSWLAQHGRSITIAATKVDRLKPNALRTSLAQLNKSYGALNQGNPVIPFSSVTRQGVDELWRAVEGFIQPRR